MGNKIQTYVVDSFTHQLFKGNPAGVCLLKNELSKSQMLSIARELGHSETAFVSDGDSENKFHIRFFSPKMEIPLCGHATLAASKIIFNQHPQFSEIFFTNIQHLSLHIQKMGEDIQMEFPVYNTVPQEAPIELLKALGIQKISNSEYNSETKILLLEISDSSLLENLTPDYERLKKSHEGINGVLVTAVSQRGNYDFESRYFWPWSGTNEDPVTGGTHTFLAKYWSKRLDKTNLNSFQCSERSGYMNVELIDDNRLNIRGRAVVFLKGEIEL